MGNFKRSCLPLINDTPAGGSDHQDVSKWQEYAGIGKFIERILGNAYFPATISRITECRKGRHRKMAPSSTAQALFGLIFGRFVCETSPRYGRERSHLCGVKGNEEGYREILDFFVGGQESAYGWQEILQQLYNRGVKEVLLGVFDGLPGLEEAFQAVYPKTGVQRCVVHKVRSTLSRVQIHFRDTLSILHYTKFLTVPEKEMRYMNKEEFVKLLHQSIIKENRNFYRDIFNNTDINEVTDPYWKEALMFYSELSDKNKEILFKIIEQVEVDAVSNILGVLDGVVSIGEEDIEFKVTINDNNEPINGDLQDLFLEYDEENR